MVEHTTENRGVPGSIPGLAIIAVFLVALVALTGAPGAVAATRDGMPAAVHAAEAAPASGARTVTPVASGSAAVTETYVRQYEPLPSSLGAPPACNWIGYLRFRHSSGPSNPSRADAVLVTMPGFLGGSSLLGPFARNVITVGASRHRNLEVWVLDRRANCLEDHSGIDAASRARNYRLALNYYYGNRAIAKHRFGGYRTSAQVPYLAEFGLAQTMRDEYAVLTRGIPDRRVRTRKVFCGGHSLGGSLTGAFASWHFPDADDAKGGPDRDDAGYAQCAGFFALDTTVTNNLGGGSKDAGPKGDALYAAETEGVRSGAIPRIAASLPVINPEVFELSGILALAAHQRPNGSALLQELPHTSNADELLRFLLSRDTADFAAADPRTFHLTNEALLGTFADDNSEPIAALQGSLGTYDGGPVVEKDFPLVSSLPDFPLLGPTLSGVLADTIVTPGGSNTRLMIPANRGPLYRWRTYDRVGASDAPAQLDNLGHPFTTPQSEVTAMSEFSHSLYAGPTDAWEQYFPMRLLMDDAAFLTGGRSGDLAAVRYENGPDLRPYLELIAGEGVATDAEYAPVEPGVGPRKRVVLTGYNHLDVATAAKRQSGGHREPESHALVRFVLNVTGQRR